MSWTGDGREGGSTAGEFVRGNLEVEGNFFLSAKSTKNGVQSPLTNCTHKYDHEQLTFLLSMAK